MKERKLDAIFLSSKTYTEHRRQTSIPDILVEPCISLLHTGFINFIPLRTQLIEKVAKIEYLYNSRTELSTRLKRDIPSVIQRNSRQKLPQSCLNFLSTYLLSSVFTKQSFKVYETSLTYKQKSPFVVFEKCKTKELLSQFWFLCYVQNHFMP